MEYPLCFSLLCPPEEVVREVKQDGDNLCVQMWVSIDEHITFTDNATLNQVVQQSWHLCGIELPQISLYDLQMRSEA